MSSIKRFVEIFFTYQIHPYNYLFNNMVNINSKLDYIKVGI